MKLTAFFLFLFIGLSACSEKNHSRKTGDKETTLKVLTYNIHHANPPSKPDFIDLNAIAKVIMESGAELVVLQEVDVNTTRSGKTSNQAEALAKLTDMEFLFSKGIDYQGGEYGTAILSKYPLLDHQRFELPNLEGVDSEPRTLAVATVDINGTKIKLGNTHLDYTNAENNLLQVKRIVEILKDKNIPVVLGGDFNAEPESASIQLLDQHFTRSCTENCAFTSPQSQPKRTIDYLMVSSDSHLEVLEHQVIEETYASDHRPVVATYRFRK